MGQYYLIDTNAVIDFLNAKLPLNAKNLLLSVAPAISVITHIELFSSNKTTEVEAMQLQKFVQAATIYDTINAEIVKQTIAIRKQHNIKTRDAIIAATAIVYNLTLVSRNTKDFANIAGLKTINPWNL